MAMNQATETGDFELIAEQEEVLVQSWVFPSTNRLALLRLIQELLQRPDGLEITLLQDLGLTHWLGRLVGMRKRAVEMQLSFQSEKEGVRLFFFDQNISEYRCAGIEESGKGIIEKDQLQQADDPRVSAQVAYTLIERRLLSTQQHLIPMEGNWLFSK